MRVPARTTLRVVDMFTESLLVILPDGRKASVGRITVRDHAYIPRSR